MGSSFPQGGRCSSIFICFVNGDKPRKALRRDNDVFKLCERWRMKKELIKEDCTNDSRNLLWVTPQYARNKEWISGMTSLCKHEGFSFATTAKGSNPWINSFQPCCCLSTCEALQSRVFIKAWACFSSEREKKIIWQKLDRATDYIMNWIFTVSWWQIKRLTSEQDSELVRR